MHIDDKLTLMEKHEKFFKEFMEIYKLYKKDFMESPIDFSNLIYLKNEIVGFKEMHSPQMQRFLDTGL